MQFPWNDQRERVFLDRYALPGKETTPKQMWARVAQAVAHDGKDGYTFQYILEDFRFLPAGRILSAAGSDQHSATWYNCFVLGMNPSNPKHGRDSRGAILTTTSRAIEILCRGGGVGINWSVLRPDRSSVRGVHGSSTGPIGWMRGADALADQVRQGGSRTAALMFMLDAWHPDIEAFVEAERFKRANFSVAVPDEFMDALARGEPWSLRFPDTSDPAYDILWDGDIEAWAIAGRKMSSREIDPRPLWKKICTSAVMTGNPGIVFIDTCNRMSTTRSLERLICTNPCGEQPLPEYGSCNLGSINLVSVCGPNGDIDKKELMILIYGAVRFLDNVIDKSPTLFHEIDSRQAMFRRIGLGTMGLADVLILNKIRYGSAESLSFIRELYSFIRDTAYKADSALASERGPAPICSKRLMQSAPWIRLIDPDVEEMLLASGMRNLSILTQAPTGTTSVLAGVSSGIEPVFSRRYVRKDATGEYAVEHPLFGDKKEAHLVTAYEILPEEHVAVQAVLQQQIDTSISKTINMPPCSRPSDVDEVFRLAFEDKCKGVTVYVGGSSESDVLCPTCTL